MRTKKTPKLLSLSPKLYFELLSAGFNNPRSYLKQATNLSSLAIISFFLINNLISSLLRFVLKFIAQKDASLIFLAVSQSLFYLPFIFFWLVVTTFSLYLLAKILSGKGGIYDTFKAVMVASPPLTILYLPYLSLIAILLFIYLLILSFKYYQQYSTTKAVINIIFPAIIVLLFLTITGIIYSFVPGLEWVSKLI